jgi:hypothetical protein
MDLFQGEQARRVEVAVRPAIVRNIHRKATKNLNKRRQRKFEQKLTKLAKVRHLPSRSCSSGYGHSLALTYSDFKTSVSNKRPQYRELRCAQISIEAQHHLTDDLRPGVLTPLPGTALPQGSTLLPLLTSVQILLFASFCEPASLVVAASPRCLLKCLARFGCRLRSDKFTELLES